MLPEHSYRLATYADAACVPRAGVVVDDLVIDAAAALDHEAALNQGAGRAHADGIRTGAPSTVLALLQAWDNVHPRLQSIALAARRRSAEHAAEHTQDLSSVALLAPVLFPGVILCAGANYKDHVAEMSKALNLPEEPDPHEIGLNPWHFLKASAACVRGPGARIALPTYSKCVDWEAEIAVVIGRRCRHVAVNEALDYVAGVTVVNDLSARDHLRRQGVAADSPFYFDWVSQKCFDGALPMGPWICPLDEIDDLGNLKIRLWVNDELMQDSSSSNLIFSVAEQIAHLSTRLTLRPGDVIATGTPAGCGAARGRYLKPGDRVRVWIETVGEITNEFA
jgi:2-keto-4-pentenoate hydratase/2-oxohepta-3-ene-1,7-dioic acid hydratase in catechol pathway